jgi:hypothetical protein
MRGQFARYQEPSSDRPVDIPFDDPHALAKGQTNLITLFLNWKTTDWWTQHFLVGAYNERYSFNDPPIPTESYPGSLYIAEAYNLEADWQNTFELTNMPAMRSPIASPCCTCNGRCLACQPVCRLHHP